LHKRVHSVYGLNPELAPLGFRINGPADILANASRARLALAANHIGLFASPAVLRQLTRLLEAVAEGQMEQHDAILTELMHAIREDLKVPGSQSRAGITFKLWSAGKKHATMKT
jgi:hypothetical protein